MNENIERNLNAPFIPETNSLAPLGERDGERGCISQDLIDLDEKAAEREENLVEWTLDSFLDKIQDQKSMLDMLFQSSPKRNDSERAVMECLTKYIADTLDGNLDVIEYSQKKKAEQIIYLYLGTHWERIHGQLYRDFVKRCVKRMKLDDIFAEDPDFMNKVYERLAFRVMGFRRLKVKRGETWINLQNGTLEIKKDGTIRMREHRAEDFFTYVLPYAYDPNATCPRWHKFLDEVLTDEDRQRLLAEYTGYCFTNNLKLEKMAVFYGTGSNGKSVCEDVITRILGGPHNVTSFALSALTNNDEKRSHIEHKLVNISHESGTDLDKAMLKQMVSGEPTEVHVMYTGSHIMYDYAKFITSYNTLPPAENTYGFYRRWILFTFDVTIPDERKDIELTNKLCTELPGIFNWVLEALIGLMQRKAFTKSQRCIDDLNSYKRSASSVNSFLYERCEIPAETKIKLSELYNAYSRYCREEELPNKCGKKSFQDALRSFGATQSTSNRFIFYNVKFKDIEDDDDPLL